MKKKFLSLIFAIAVLLSVVIPSLADGPGTVYVDTSYDGNEEGSADKPYNTASEGRAYLQSLPNGGHLYTRSADGTWVKGEYVPPVASGSTGLPLSQTVLYALLAILALGLSLVGWRLIRKNQQAEARR